MNEIFDVPKLETVEIDVNKKIYRVNGKDFGKHCVGFEMACDVTRGFKLKIDTKEYETEGTFELRTGEARTISTTTKCGDWILCTERLPEDKVPVLVSLKFGRIEIDYRHNGEWHNWWEKDVVAWMPLPEPYN